MHFSAGCVSELRGSRRRARKARPREHKTVNTRRTGSQLLVFHGLVLSRVGRFAANDVDGCPCLRVKRRRRRRVIVLILYLVFTRRLAKQSIKFMFRCRTDKGWPQREAPAKVLSVRQRAVRKHDRSRRQRCPYSERKHRMKSCCLGSHRVIAVVASSCCVFRLRVFEFSWLCLRGCEGRGEAVRATSYRLRATG